MKVAIIGGGHMGGATALGLGNTGKYQVFVTAKHSQTLAKFEGSGVLTSTSNVPTAGWADIVVLAVRPVAVPEVVSEIADKLAGKILVSMVAGVPSSEMLKIIPSSTQLFFAIPNLAIEFGKSMTFLSPVRNTQESEDTVNLLFNSVGWTMIVPESLLGAGTAIGSCGVAYALRYIYASAQAGIEMGLNPAEAISASARTVAGAAAILMARHSHPEVEVDKVATPGGITIKGLNAMEKAGFTNAVISGILAGVKK